MMDLCNLTTFLVIGRDEEVGRRVGVGLVGVEDDLGAGHVGGVVGDGLG